MVKCFCGDFAKYILQHHVVDISKDKDDTHPKTVCTKCHRRRLRYWTDGPSQTRTDNASCPIEAAYLLIGLNSIHLLSVNTLPVVILKTKERVVDHMWPSDQLFWSLGSCFRNTNSFYQFNCGRYVWYSVCCTVWARVVPKRLSDHSTPVLSQNTSFLGCLSFSRLLILSPPVTVDDKI